MTTDNVFSKVQDVFRIVLDNESIVLTPETTANNIDEWDSLTHIQLIVAIEKQYLFCSSDIKTWRSVLFVTVC